MTLETFINSNGLTWALFGNDDDGIYGQRAIWVPGFGPWAPQTFATAAKWWLRNPFHNLLWHKLVWVGGPYFEVRRWGWKFYVGWRKPQGVFGLKLAADS